MATERPSASQPTAGAITSSVSAGTAIVYDSSAGERRISEVIMRSALNVNGRQRDVEAPPGTSLLAALRDDLGLTATRFGCGLGQCGACYELLDGVATASCNLPLEEVGQRRIVTVEGLADVDSGAPLH